MRTKNQICISSVCATVLEAFGIDIPENIAKPNPVLQKFLSEKFGKEKADRVVLYNPDAVALWLYQKYTDKFTDAAVASNVALPMLSVMPSVTPVCFATMYSGVMPSVHGIQKYTKPVLTVDTLFDYCIRAGKKCAVVSSEGDSISMIFLNREMDYFIFPTVDEINKKAKELIDKDEYDLIVIYNGNFDGTMHKNGPESAKAFKALEQNVSFYGELVDLIKEKWRSHRVFYGFCPDHGCHKMPKDTGGHGMNVEYDMNIIHFYGSKDPEI